MECLALWEVIGFTSAAMHVPFMRKGRPRKVPRTESTMLSKIPAVRFYSVSWRVSREDDGTAEDSQEGSDD